ncbi:DNA gyrase inhibitor YacG [Azospirillum argentinense]
MNDNQKPKGAKPNEKACPICGRPAVEETKPFCSKRCADVDLSRWLGGVYRIESPDRPEAEEADERE